ncbi:MAG: hypothetical protein DMF25_09325 [Verrucomicrobia bacterium]|nr:MAG: hypothetical protein DMF25_09325 [Verrucomicrobiota bacterium]
MGQRAERDEQTNHGFGLKKIWELRLVWQNLSSHQGLRDSEIEVSENFQFFRKFCQTHHPHHRTS